jgi:hypothetical protein
MLCEGTSTSAAAFFCGIDQVGIEGEIFWQWIRGQSGVLEFCQWHMQIRLACNSFQDSSSFWNPSFTTTCQGVSLLYIC